jgi:hypothetical protein
MIPFEKFPIPSIKFLKQIDPERHGLYDAHNIISFCRIYAKAIQALFCLPTYGFLLTTFLGFDILKSF